MPLFAAPFAVAIVEVMLELLLLPAEGTTLYGFCALLLPHSVNPVLNSLPSGKADCYEIGEWLLPPLLLAPMVLLLPVALLAL